MFVENVCDQNHSMGKHLQFLSHTEHVSMKLAKEAIGKVDYWNIHDEIIAWGDYSHENVLTLSEAMIG